MNDRKTETAPIFSNEEWRDILLLLNASVDEYSDSKAMHVRVNGVIKKLDDYLGSES